MTSELMRFSNFTRSTALAALFLTSACAEQSNDGAETAAQESAQQLQFSVPFESITLDNGLQVIFHIDRSDPVVAVALTSHVGSARELPGRTGFAHLFEHLLFLESENLGKGGLDQMSARIGGSGANGSTSRDRTNYYQTVPNDALEKMIWAEADKLGFFINTVTEQVLAKEKEVVKNEKRQRVDNRAYGHNQYVIDKALYPQGHPYSWQVIGSLEDLQNATVDDVKTFFRQWYTPNNVTLTIAGDFDIAQAEAWVQQYFDEIERGPEISPLSKQPAQLAETVKLYHEDNFATLPMLTYTWPGVPQYHQDSYALNVLGQYLSEGKTAPFNAVLIDEEKLSADVSMGDYNSELAGQIILQTRAFNGVDLDSVAAAYDIAFARFESNGISDADLDRIKAGQETDFYMSLASSLGKAFQLAQYQIFAGDPGFVEEDIKNILAVTTDDVRRVYETYIKEKPFVATSFVPMGAIALALENSSLANIVEEPIVAGAEASFDASQIADYERTPTSFDRTVEPPYGPAPEVKAPEVWQTTTERTGLSVYGIESSELPLVQFDLSIDGGQLLDTLNKVGVANLLGQVMNRGTANRTPAELELAIENLGATININMDAQQLHLQGSTLAQNYTDVIALATEMLLEPRFDPEEFDLAQRRTLDAIRQREANPDAVAEREFAKLIYGQEHILSVSNVGTLEGVASITLQDLQNYYSANISPNLANFHIVGDVNQTEVMLSLNTLDENWQIKNPTIPNYPLPPALETSTLYFYDVPGSSQSTFMFGYLALPVTDPDFYKASVMNYRLGGGGFASVLTQELRESKGYTYRIRSGFTGTNLPGPFTVSSSIRSNVTFEAATLIKEILINYSSAYESSDHELTQNFMLKSQARAFETLGAKLGVLQNMSAYGWTSDYAQERAQIVRDLSVDDIKTLAEEFVDPQRMHYLIVGDAESQLEQLSALGFGDPVLINP